MGEPWNRHDKYFLVFINLCKLCCALPTTVGARVCTHNVCSSRTCICMQSNNSCCQVHRYTATKWIRCSLEQSCATARVGQCQSTMRVRVPASCLLHSSRIYLGTVSVCQSSHWSVPRIGSTHGPRGGRRRCMAHNAYINVSPMFVHHIYIHTS